MMVGGYLFATDGWAVAGPAMLPAGPLISIGFFLARRPGRADRQTGRKERVRHIASVLLGLPSPGSDLALTTSLATSVVTLLAGALMMIAGYATAAWNPALVPPLVLAAGLIIAAAFVIVDRADRQRHQTRYQERANPSSCLPASKEPPGPDGAVTTSQNTNAEHRR